MLSEGSESTRSLEILAWIEVHKKRLIVGVLAVALVLVAVVIQRWMHRESERAASVALLELAGSAPGEGGAGPGASAYQELALAHSGTGAAARARLLAAERLFLDGHYGEARAEFAVAAGVLTDPSLVAVAELGVATSLEALGQTNEALEAYRDVTVRHATAAAATQARLAIAGLYEERGEIAEALRGYGELTNLLTSPWSEEARERAESILMRHPEVAPSVAAPALPGVEPVTNVPVEPTEGARAEGMVVEPAAVESGN